MLTGNTLEDNFFHGIFNGNNSTLLAQENTLRRNRGNGLWLVPGSTTSLSGGLITLNGYAGMYLPEGASASIGLDGAAELVVSHNVAAGLLVETDSASARINSGRIHFDANGGGAIVGRVTDVFVDSERDGLGDTDEAQRGTDPRRADTDGDGLRDGFEVRYGLAPLDPRDSLADPDGDGFTNVEEQAAGTDPRHPDTDSDGLTDGDEVHLYGTDPTRTDTDGVGLTDSEEVRRYGTNPLVPDSDGDGVRDGIEVASGSDPRDPRSVPTAVLYGINQLRNDVLVLHPDTGQAFVLGPPTGDPNLASGAPSTLGHVVWSPHSRTLYALAFGFLRGTFQVRLHTLDPDTGAIRSTVVVGPVLLTALAVDARGTLLAAIAFNGGSLTDLGRLDPATGVVTRLGPTGFRNLFGMQFDPAFRTLYAITGAQIPPVLVALDPATGQGTAIAQTDLPTQATSLSFLADGRLIVGGDDGNLYQVDPVTGASRLIGPTAVEQVSSMSLRVFPRR